MELQIYKALLDALQDLNERRLERLLAVQGSLLSPMWLILLIGGICTIVGLYYLSLSHNRIQVVVDLILIGIIVISILLIGELNKPFQGNITISDKAFRMVREKVEAAQRTPLPLPGSKPQSAPDR